MQLSRDVQGILYSCIVKPLTIGEGLDIQKERRDVITRYGEDGQDIPEYATGLINYPLFKYAVIDLVIDGVPITIDEAGYMSIVELVGLDILRFIYEVNPHQSNAYMDELKKTILNLTGGSPDTSQETVK